MSNCQHLHIPGMYLDDATTGAMDQWFGLRQGAILSAVMGPAGHLFYRASELVAMHTYFSNPLQLGVAATAIRIYFACYGAAGSPGLPDPSLAGKFTLIFAPATLVPPVHISLLLNQARDVGYYYNIPPGGAFNSVTSKISTDLFTAWTNNWKTQLDKLPADPVDDNNGSAQDTPAIYTETKCVFYTTKAFTELISEIQCQGADGVRISLTSHLDFGKFSKRLTTQFKLTDANDNPIYIDLTGRPPASDKEFASFDTGVPCPPYTGCPIQGPPNP